MTNRPKLVRPIKETVKRRWLPETLFDELGIRMTYEAERILVERKTEHQNLVLFQHGFLGKVLMLDGVTQVTTRDEFVYHEMMTHVPILAHGHAKEILVIGGGDCGIAEEVLKHKSVRRLTQVEIDGAVINFSKKYLPELSPSVFMDKRFHLVIEDGVKFVAATDQRFDVIIVDSTDPQGPGRVLFTRDFYACCKRCLAAGGVIVTQNGVPFLQSRELAKTIGHFHHLFADATCYLAPVPTYVGGHLAMCWGSKNRQLRKSPIRMIAARYEKASKFRTSYWTPEIHVASFALPKFIADVVAAAKRK